MKLVNQLKLKHLEKKKTRLYKKLQRINDSIIRIEFNHKGNSKIMLCKDCGESILSRLLILS